MPRPVALVGFLVVLGVAPGNAQSPDPSPSLTPGPWEVTAALTIPTYLNGSPDSDLLTSSRGLGARVGLRPTSSRRALVEAYGLYAPSHSVALRAEAGAHAPLALGGDQGSPHLVWSIGLSIRP